MCPLGLIASLTTVIPRCRLHMRIIHFHVLSKFRSYRHRLSCWIPATNRLRKTVSWWTQPSNIYLDKQFSPRPTSPTLTQTEWGPHWKKIYLSGTWSPSLAMLAKHHIDLLNHPHRSTPSSQASQLAVHHGEMRHLGGDVYLNKMGGVRCRCLCLQTACSGAVVTGSPFRQPTSRERATCQEKDSHQGSSQDPRFVSGLAPHAVDPWSISLRISIALAYTKILRFYVINMPLLSVNNVR